MKPSLNLVYEEKGLRIFLVDIGDHNLQIHCDITGKIPFSRIKHFEEVFITLIGLLADKGMQFLNAWVQIDRPEQKRFAEFFGFQSTGFNKILLYDDGKEMMMEEMVYIFPIEENE